MKAKVIHAFPAPLLLGAALLLFSFVMMLTVLTLFSLL